MTAASPSRGSEPVPVRTPLVAWFDQLHDLTPSQRDAALVKLTGDLIVHGMVRGEQARLDDLVDSAIRTGREAAA